MLRLVVSTLSVVYLPRIWPPSQQNSSLWGGSQLPSRMSRYPQRPRGEQIQAQPGPWGQEYLRWKGQE